MHNEVTSTRMTLLDCTRDRDSYPDTWSSDEFAENFQTAYKLSDSRDTIPQLGSALVCPRELHGNRFLTWEIVEGTMCIRDNSVTAPLCNRAVCVRFGASPILAVSADSSMSGGVLALVLSVVQQDGAVHTVHVRSSDVQGSLLEQLVLAQEGGTVNLGGMDAAEFSHLGLGRGSRKPQAALSSKAHTGSLRVSCAHVKTLPVDRDVTCAHWASQSLLLLGLSQGDVLAVSLTETASEAGAAGALKLQLSEQLLRDRGAGLQALWSGLLRGATDSNSDTISIAARSSSALAINRSGELRVWGSHAQTLVAQSSVYEVLDAVDALASVLPAHGEHGAPADQAAAVLLQGCLVHIATDTGGVGRSNASPYLLAAVAVLPEEAAESVSARGASQRRATGPLVGLVSGAIPLSQQAWQIMILAWRETSGAATGTAEKPKLVCQPVVFPAGEPCWGAGAGYVYRCAALVDVQLTVDEVRGVAVLTTCWRAEVGPAQGEQGRGTVLEGLVGRTEIPLADLRAQGYTPPGSTGAGPTRVSELVAPSRMTLVAHSAALDGIRLRMEDGLVQRQLESSLSSGATSVAKVERAIKRSMLQRIFLRRRFSTRVLCVAYDALSAKTGAGDGVFRSEESKHSLDKATPFAELPALVLALCQRVAADRLRTVVAAGSITGRTRDVAQSNAESQHQYLRLLLDAFAAFIAESETASQRLGRVNAGSMCAIPANESAPGCALLARHDGDHSLIYEHDGYGAALSGQEDRQDVAGRMMSLMSDQFASGSSVLPDCFVEMDALAEQFFAEGSFAPAGAEWVQQYFASLAPSLRSLLPNLPSLHSAQYLDGLVERISPAEEWQDFAAAALDQLAQSAEETLERPAATTSADPAAVLQLALVAVRGRLRESKMVLSLLCLYLDAGVYRMSAAVCRAVKEVYIPLVVQHVLHYSALLWMDTLRPSDNSALRYEVELAGLLPLSAGTSGPEARAADPKLSVLENFVRHACSKCGEGTVDVSVRHVLASMQPSPLSGLTTYLLQAGQYVSLSRWASVQALGLRASCESGDASSPAKAAGLSALLSVMTRYRLRVTTLTAELFELLRAQWFALRHKTSHRATGASSGLEQQIAVKTRELMTAADEIAELAQELQGESQYLPSPAISPASNVALTAAAHAPESVPGVARRMVAYLVQLGRRIANQEDASAVEDAQSQRNALRRELDGLLALGDALLSVSQVTLRQAQLATLWVDGSGGAGDVASAGVLLRLQGSGVCSVLSLAGTEDVLEIVDRALSLLPRTLGAGLAQDGALLLVDRVSQVLDSTQNSAPRPCLSANAMMTELHGAWSRVFEYALLHGGRFSVALDALLHVAELEEQRLVDTSSLAAAGITWRDALRAMVSHACSSGALGWLCSIPEQQLQGFAKQGVSLADAISSTLDALAATLEVPTSAAAVNYYECLFVYQLSRRDFQDGARVMHALSARSEAASSDPTVPSRALASALTALTVQSADQAYLLMRNAQTPESSRRIGAADQQNAVQCLDAQTLALAFADKNCARQQIAAGVASGDATTNRVLALCNSGRAHEALSLAVLADAAAPSTTALCRLALVMLAKSCVGADAADADFVSASERDHFLRAPYGLSCAPAPETWADARWHALVETLRCLRRGPPLSIDPYEVTVRALLAFHARYNPGTPLQLPRPLVDDMCGLPSLSESSAGGDDARALWKPSSTVLLGLLMEFGSLADACTLSARLLHSANEQVRVHASRAAGECRLWMPYCAFDQLLELCRRRDSEEQRSFAPADLIRQREHASLKKALSQHFSLLLLASAK